MAQLFIDAASERDQRRVVLLSQALENEFSKALLDTVRMTIESLEKTLQRDGYDLTRDQMRYKVAQINTLKAVLELPKSALEYIANTEKR